MGLPSHGGLSAFSVNRPGWECIRQSLYDSIPLPGGVPLYQLFFFQEGEGGQSGKTLSDTNLPASGMLQENQEFLIQSVEFHIFGYVPTVTTQLPAYYDGAANWADAVNLYAMAHGFLITLTVGSKPYLQDAPLVRFPPKSFFDVHAAASDATTRAGGQFTRISACHFTGRPYALEPAEIWLQSKQDFSVSLQIFSGTFALPQTARMVCVLDGLLFRRSQ